MDQIGKALEKARLAREKASSGPVWTPQNGGGPTAITYKQTRVEKTSPDTLEHMRVVTEAFRRGAVLDIYRMLRAQVLQRLDSVRGTTIGVCSPNPGEGKSLSAANLAVSLAMDVNHTVLLVDLDLRRPRIHTFFGLTPQIGLVDFLLGQAELPDCLINPGIDRLVILPAGSARSESSELLSSPKMTNLAIELKTRYANRLVIYDVPPLLSSDDAIAFLPQVDTTLLIIQEGSTQRLDIQRAQDLLKNTNLAGTVLNKSAQSGMRSYY